MFVMYLAVY